jgi:hypothetical protein
MDSIKTEIVEERDKHVRGSPSSRTVAAVAGTLSGPGGGSGSPGRPYTPGTMLQEGEPSVVDVEEFQYRYRCKHCAHEWSEVHEADHKVKEPKGYTGD